VIKVCAPLSPGQAVETFARHPSPIRGAALTSDGQRLFVAGGQRLPLTGEKCRVRLWDVGKRTLLGEREAPCVVTAFALGPDDDLLAVGGGHGQLCLWRWSEPSPRPIHGCEGTLNAIAFAHDGQRIAAVAGENIVRVWDVTTGTPHLALDGHKSGISSVAFAPDAERLATGSNDQTVKLWNLNLGAEGLPANPHAGAVAGLAISGDGKTLVTAAMDRSIKIWELPERAKLQAPSRHEAGREGTINLRHHVQDVIQYGALAISRDGQTLVHVDRAGRCVVRSARTGEVERYLPDLKLPPYALVMSPDGNTLAVSGKSAAIRILDPQTGAVRALLQGHTGTYVNHLHFKSDRELASADSKDVILWDLSTGKPRRTLSGAGSVSRLAFAPDGSRLAIGRSDGAILLWSPEKEGTASLLLGHEKFVAALAWTADSRSLASGSIDGVRLWDPIMMQELAVLRDPRGPVFALLFTPDDRTLISAGGRLAPEGYVRFWHASP
jgi:WD40 repeat protein